MILPGAPKLELGIVWLHVCDRMTILCTSQIAIGGVVQCFSTWKHFVAFHQFYMINLQKIHMNIFIINICTNKRKLYLKQYF